MHINPSLLIYGSGKYQILITNNCKFLSGQSNQETWKARMQVEGAEASSRQCRRYFHQEEMAPRYWKITVAGELE